MPFSSDDVNWFYSNGIFPGSRTLYLGANNGSEEDYIEGALTSKMIKGLHLLDIDYNKIIPISVIVNTGGGCAYNSLAIYDAIRACQNNVVTIGIGKVMSGGAIVLQAGDERVMYPNCTFLMHYGSLTIDEKNKDLEETIKENQRINDFQLDLFYRHMKEKKKRITKKEVNELLNTDTHLTAQQCLQLGLIDRIKE